MGGNLKAGKKRFATRRTWLQATTPQTWGVIISCVGTTGKSSIIHCLSLLPLSFLIPRYLSIAFSRIPIPFLRFGAFEVDRSPLH